MCVLCTIHVSTTVYVHDLIKHMVPSFPSNSLYSLLTSTSPPPLPIPFSLSFSSPFLPIPPSLPHSMQKQSQVVARVVEVNLGKYLEPQFVQLLCCFLNPESVIRKGEPPTKDPIISLLLPSSNGNPQGRYMFIDHAI